VEQTVLLHAAAEGLPDRGRLLLDLLEHEELVAAALRSRGVTDTPDRGGLTIEGPDVTVYDHVRDALVEAQAPLRRMGPRRRELTELFEREEKSA